MHSADSLAALSDEELDAIVAEAVFGIASKLVHGERASWYEDENSNQIPAYSSSWEGIGLIVEHMRSNGWTFTLDVSLDNEWPEARFHKPGMQMGAASAATYPRAVATAAVLAVQGKS
jgi:hypothetical protein